MSDAIFMLRLEHSNTARLLDLLEDQLLRLDSGAPVDGDLLLLAHEYLAGFPEQCHHPKEDVLYGLLERRDPVAARSLASLLAEHRQLAQQTERLGNELREVIGGSKQPGGSLATSLREFLALQRKHMAREERDFFPAALRALTRSDMADLDERLFDRRDLLFDRESEARFERLRSAIRALAADPARRLGHAGSPAGHDEISLLRRLSTVEEFNRAMASRGLRLVVYRSGGYSLEQGGQWMLDIPDCDEARAVWSAYHFVKGQEEARGRADRSAEAE